MSTMQNPPSDTDQARAGMPVIDQIRNWWSGPHKTWEAINHRIASAHPLVQEVGQRRRANLQAWIALILAFFFILGALASSAARGASTDANEWVLIFLTIVMLLAYGLTRSPYYDWGGWLVTGSVVIAGYGFVLTGQGSSTTLDSFIPLAFILGSILLSPWPLFFWVVVGVSAMFFIPARFNLDVGTASGIFTTLGVLLLIAVSFRNSVERGRLAELRSANEALKDFQGKLEQRVAERTKALETSAEVSRYLTSILDPRELASAVVHQVQTAFNYYHAQIYLFDETSENLVLAAGTGEAGTAMLKRGHALRKGRGLVGRAAEGHKSVLVSDTSQASDWLPNELLPDTKTEAAVPIAIGDRVLGVLDVQDDVTNNIASTDLTLLESIASQVAISLQNAASYAKAEAALQEARSLVENAPEAVVIIDLATGTFSEPNENAVRLYGMPREELVKVGPAQMSPPRQPDGRDSTEAALKKIGEAMQGKTPVFDWIHCNAQGQEIPCEIRLVRLPGDKPRVRASVTDITERIRLQELTAQRARQQEMINTITQRIQSAATIEEAMQVAARELGNALGKRQTLVALEPSALGGENGKTLVTS